MTFDAVTGVLVIPAVAAALLAALPGYRVTARLNVAATTLTLICALSLFFRRPPPGVYLLVDDLNGTFIVLTTFVGFTTSVFSLSYIGHELETGRLTPPFVRFYHAMYQVLMFAMNLALVANNIGLMWVAIELATLTTVLMVGIYRTHEALEAAWKYFILGSVGIALALFGTILIYMAARPVVGEGLDAMVWTVLVTRAGAFDPALLDVAFVFLLLGYGTKVGLAPLHAWLPDAHAEGPTPISAVLSGLLLNVALYALLRFKMLLAVNAGGAGARPADGDARLALAGVRGLHALPPPRHQTPVRLFVDRAHGHHRVCFRHGRPDRQFRRSAAHDHAFADQVGDLLRRRPCRAGQGHPAHRRHGRADRDASGARLGAYPRRRGDRRTAAARHFHERIPDGDLDLRPRAAARASFLFSAFWSASPRCSCGSTASPSASRAAPAPRRRRPTCRCSRIWRWCSPPASTCRRPWSPGSRTSPDCWVKPMPPLIDIIKHGERVEGHRPWPRLIVTADEWRHVAREIAAGRATLVRPVGRHRRRAHGAHGDHRGSDRRDRGDQPRLSGEKISLGRRAASARHPARARHSQSLWANAGRRAGCAALARSRLLGRAASARRPPAGAGRASGLRVPAGGRREPASDSRSARCTPASSSRDISASPPAARPWRGSNSGSATCTRASSR